MAKSNSKVLRKIYRDAMKSIDATDEQLAFLAEQYQDEESIIGIHNTFLSYESFFEIGLRNYSSMDKEKSDLSNTVMYTDMFSALAMYPNGDGKRRGQTAIILKIPKKVFMKEQGIFEELSDGRYGIPPQFIVGAFTDGIVVSNDKHDKEYNNENAKMCEDKIITHDKKEELIAFKKEYSKKRNSIKSRIMNFINKIKNKRRTKMLPSGEEMELDVDTGKSSREKLIERLQENIGQGIETIALANLENKEETSVNLTPQNNSR